MGIKRFLILITIIFYSCSQNPNPPNNPLKIYQEKWHEKDYVSACQALGNIKVIKYKKNSYLKGLAKCRALGFTIKYIPESKEEAFYLKAMSISPGMPIDDNLRAITQLQKIAPDNIQYKWQKALLLMIAHDYKSACKVLDSLPLKNKYIVLKAECLLKLGNRKNALKALSYLSPIMSKRVLKRVAYLYRILREKYPMPYNMAHSMIKVFNLFKIKAYPGAKNILKNIVSQYPSFPEPWYLLALLELNEGNRSKAVLYLQKALFCEPNNIDSLVLMARLELASQNFTESISLLRKSIKIAPYEQNIYDLFLRVCVKSNDRKCEFDTLLSMNQHFGAVLGARQKLRYGILLEEQGRHQEAMKIYDELILLQDEFIHTEALLGKARLLVLKALDGDRKSAKQAEQILKSLSVRYSLDPRPSLWLNKLKGINNAKINIIPFDKQKQHTKKSNKNK